MMNTLTKIKTFFFLLLSPLVFSCDKSDVGSEQTPMGTAISYLLPNRGYEGQNMIIVGHNFGNSTEGIEIDFGGRALTPNAISDKAISVTIPEFAGEAELGVSVVINGKKTNVTRFFFTERETINPQPIGTRITNTGHLVDGQVREVRSLRGAGPFIRLNNGSIFTVAEGSSVASISYDEGLTWTSYDILPNANYSFLSPYFTVAADGSVVVGFSNGREIVPLNWNTSTKSYNPNATLPTYTIRSTDHGRTWGTPVKLHDEWTGMNRDMITLNNGKIVFATMKMFNHPGRHTVLTYTSADNGMSWQASNVLHQPGSPSGDHAGFMESTLTELTDGRLWMLIRTNLDYMYETYSNDDGLTWSTPQRMNIDASSSPAVLKRLQSGRLILVWNRLYPEGRTEYHRMSGDGNLAEVAASWHRDELSMMFSDDEGASWSDPVIVAKNHLHAPSTPANAWDQSKWLSYPLLFEVRPGVIWLTTGHGGLKIEFKEEDHIQ